MKIRLTWLSKKMLCPDFSLLAVSAEMIQPTGQRLCNIRMQQFFLMGPILFLYYEESLVSSNLNSKLLWFHSAHPSVGIFTDTDLYKLDIGKRI